MTNITENTSSPELKFGDNIRDSLENIRKWAMFLAIMGFIFIGLLIIFGFSFGFIMKAVVGEDIYSGIPSFLFGIIYLIFGIIYFFPLYYLYRFSSFAKKGLQVADPESMDKAFRNLKVHYTFIGVLTAIMVGLYILMGIIFALVAIIT